MAEIASNQKRKVRTILLNSVRILLILVAIFALKERILIFITSIICLFITFIPFLVGKFFKKEPPWIFDFVLIILLFGVLSFWEIKGVYTNNWSIAFIMNLAQASAISLFGLSLVYSLFKHTGLNSNALIVSMVSFCVALSLGALIEIGKSFFDFIFLFRLHEVGAFTTAGDLTVYLFSSIFVSTVGYFSLKQGKPILISKLLENFIEKNYKILGLQETSSQTQSNKIVELIRKGENHKLEFKSTLRKNIHTNTMDKQIEHATLKTINAYLNSEGGTLLIGVSDKGEILGMDADQFSNQDHAQRHFAQLINDHLGGEVTPLIQSEIFEVDGKNILKVDCKKSSKESFLKHGKEEHFYVRQGSTSMPLHGSSLIKYIENTFRN